MNILLNINILPLFDHKSRFLLERFPILSDNKAFHVPLILILASSHQITQSTPEKWGLCNLGRAIASLTLAIKGGVA
jgi:hypothetical protein